MTTNKTLLWLDDVRDPKTNMWHNWIAKSGFNPFNHNVVWVMTYDEFINHIKINGLPEVIFFDHDLGEEGELTGFDCAKWLVDYCIDNDLELPKWVIQSANPVGVDNINGLLVGYLKFRNK